MENETPEQAAKRIFIDCYPNELDNGNVVKKVWAKYYAKIIIKFIIKETLDEYTNDENHVRIIFWSEALTLIDKVAF